MIIPKINIKYVGVGVLLTVVIVISFLLLKSENYSMTLGNYGHQEPSFCFEDKPNVRFKNLYICNACSLSCSTKESWDKCQTCMQNLNNILPSVL